MGPHLDWLAVLHETTDQRSLQGAQSENNARRTARLLLFRWAAIMRCVAIAETMRVVVRNQSQVTMQGRVP